MCVCVCGGTCVCGGLIHLFSEVQDGTQAVRHPSSVDLLFETIRSYHQPWAECACVCVCVCVGGGGGGGGVWGGGGGGGVWGGGEGGTVG